ncbi:AN1-type zinc finger protein TMC1 [Candida viswanathii]|uniref:AN1-type zinc finger protein TMC1 n=1 Tax=Candida viswanathii TaxID=5486 RepID=A0A367YNB6_9ASCO|nr:AN1-type zinc finger protein TMC1 [Candida viswanathii]
MKVTVRLSTESSFTVTIPDNSTVDDLKDSVKVGLPPNTNLPTDFKLIFNGKKLQPYYSELQSFGLAPSEQSEQDTPNTVILMADSTDTPPITPQPSMESLNTTTANTTPAPASPSTVKKTKKKNKCSFKTCNSAPLRMVGTCTHCQGKFCAKHRLLEDHLCTNLQYCKDNAHEKNAMKLQSERTIVNRV